MRVISFILLLFFSLTSVSTIASTYDKKTSSEIIKQAETSYKKVLKVKNAGNENVWITDRGSMFGYHDMVVDFRGIPTMREFAPTVLDVTHSLQQPNQKSGVTGGRPEMIETIARAGVVNNIDGLFIETHFDPANAKSDGANMLHLDRLEPLLKNLAVIRKMVNSL